MLAAALGLALSASGPSFDCARAAAADERLVCASEALSAQDRRLAVLYSWALELTPMGPVRAGVKPGQLAWLKRRRGCAGKPSVEACVTAVYAARIAALERLLPDGCPDAVLIGRKMFEPGANGCEERSATWPELSSTELPGATAFNATFRRGWTEPCTPSRETPHPTEFTGPFAPGVPGSDELDHYIPWATPRFVTVVFRKFSMGAGAAHPNTSYEAKTFDLELGRAVGIDDVLVADRAVRMKLAEKVLGRLDRALLFDETDAAAVAGVVSESAVWILDGHGATIRFPRYSVAPYASGDLDVRLTWKELRPWLRPDTLLPPKSGERGPRADRRPHGSP